MSASSGGFAAGVLALLDAGDGGRRLLARPVRSELPVAADGEALDARRPPALGHVDLSARGVDADPEAGEVAVPEDGLLALDGLSPSTVRLEMVSSPRFGIGFLGKPFVQAVMEGAMAHSEHGQSPAERGVGNVVFMVYHPLNERFRFLGSRRV